MRTLRFVGLLLIASGCTAFADSGDEWELHTNAAIERSEARDFVGAEKELKAALKVAEKAGQKDPRIARSHANLGRLYQTMKKRLEAEDSFKKAVDAADKIDGPQSRAVLPHLDELGFFYLTRAQGVVDGPSRMVSISTTYKIVQYTPIAPARSQTVSIAAPAGGAPKVANLAYAERYLTRALVIRDKHPEIPPAELIQNLLLLAEVREHQDDIGGMIADFSRVLSIAEQATAGDHGYLAGMLSRLEKLHARKNHAAQIEALFGRAIALLERQHGPEHGSVATVVHNLGVLYLLAEKYVEAEPLFARCVAIFEKAGGPQNAALRIPLLNWAKTLRALGREQEAQKAEARAKSL